MSESNKELSPAGYQFGKHLQKYVVRKGVTKENQTPPSTPKLDTQKKRRRLKPKHKRNVNDSPKSSEKENVTSKKENIEEVSTKITKKEEATEKQEKESIAIVDVPQEDETDEEDEEETLLVKQNTIYKTEIIQKIDEEKSNDEEKEEKDEEIDEEDGKAVPDVHYEVEATPNKIDSSALLIHVIIASVINTLTFILVIAGIVTPTVLLFLQYQITYFYIYSACGIGLLIPPLLTIYITYMILSEHKTTRIFRWGMVLNLASSIGICCLSFGLGIGLSIMIPFFLLYRTTN